MRLAPDEEQFGQYLNSIGNGKNFIPNTKFIKLNDINVVDHINQIIDFCYSKEALND